MLALTCALLAGYVSSFCIFYFTSESRVCLLLSMQCLTPSGPLSVDSCENLVMNLELQYNFWKAKLLLCVKSRNTAKRYHFGVHFLLFFSYLTVY